MRRSVWIGWDPNPKEVAAYAVAKHTLKKNLTGPLQVSGLILKDLQSSGIYSRPMRIENGAMIDVVSNAKQSTEHANSRFFVPYLAKTGWALFTDADVMFRKNILRVFDRLDPKYAVYCVHHNYAPEATTKMEGQAQVQYPRKNWSSVCFFNCDHPANKALTLTFLNNTPGRDLHRFCWLTDGQIGELGPEMNFLVGHNKIQDTPDPTIVHFTEGTPNMAGYENVDFADEWRKALEEWA